MMKLPYEMPVGNMRRRGATANISKENDSMEVGRESGGAAARIIRHLDELKHPNL